MIFSSPRNVLALAAILPPMSHRRSRTNLIAHAVWATKKREPLLHVSIDKTLAVFLRVKAVEIQCELLAIGNADDHVHVLVRYPSKVAVADGVHDLKGASSYQSDGVTDPWGCSLFWQDGFWAESCGPQAIAGLIRYIARQRQHHACSVFPEPWELALCPTERPARPALGAPSMALDQEVKVPPGNTSSPGNKM